MMKCQREGCEIEIGSIFGVEVEIIYKYRLKGIKISNSESFRLCDGHASKGIKEFRNYILNDKGEIDVPD